MTDTLYQITTRVRVLDGDRPGTYLMRTFHEETCARFATGKDEGVCDCDTQIAPLEFVHGLEGPD
jgi:hypothetical protein